MYVRFERIRRPNSFNDTRITDLSWMMTESAIHNPELAPDYLPNQNENFSNLNSRNNDPIGLAGQDHIYIGPDNLPRILLNNQNNYQQNHNHGNEKFEILDGWLAVATVRGIIGISYTTIDLNHIQSFQEIQSLPPVPPPPPPPLITNYNRQINLEENENLYIYHNHSVSPPPQPNFNPIPARTNFNLRGHRADLIFVRWNEQYQKLASCDRNGVIFVWIKYEGRWSIELINDRNTRVIDFSWSHDGRMALICYMDGFVLVGSVSGQRYWSSTLNLNDGNITCGGWSIDNQHVLFGTSNGHILVITVHGVFITQVSVQEGVEVSGLKWSYKRPYLQLNETKNQMLAVSFVDGTIFLMKNYDEIFPIIIETSLINVKMEWSNKGEILAVGGHRLKKSSITGNFFYQNLVRFYSKNGLLMKQINLDFTNQPLSALAWACNDCRLFIACGQILYTAWILCGAPSLTFFAGQQLYHNIKNEAKIAQLNAPVPVKNVLCELFSSTIHCHLPDYENICPFVFRPPANNLRLYCTLIRQSDIHNVNADVTYILYLEYMGGFVPILKGKRSSRIKPEFVIFNPQRLTDNKPSKSNKNSSISKDKRSGRNLNSNTPSRNVTSDSDYDDDSLATNSSSSIFGPYLTPKTRRRLRFRANQLRRFRRANIEQFMQSQYRNNNNSNNNNNNNANRDNIGHYYNHQNRNQILHDHNNNNNNNNFNQYYNFHYRENPISNELDFSNQEYEPLVDELPENERIVLITSNIWGTKFKFIGLTSKLPTYLGSVTYRTSLLHLQPRQMSLVIKELNESNTLINNEQMVNGMNEMSLDNISTSTMFGIKSSTPANSTAYYSSDSEDEFTMEQYQNMIDNNMMATVAPMQSFQFIRNSMLMENNVVAPPNPPMPPQPPSLPSAQASQFEQAFQQNEQLSEQEIVPEQNSEIIQPIVVQNEILVDVLPQQSQSINDNNDPEQLENFSQQNQIENNEMESQMNNQNSIITNYSNLLSDEFLTLQIQPNDNGGSCYNMEIKPSSSSAFTDGQLKLSQSSMIENQELELIESPLSPQWNHQFSTSTMVQQFKHQTFHSESPKHVAGCYRQTQLKTQSTFKHQTSSLSSPTSSKMTMYTMSSSSKQKSPRKSSVSYCSNEFGNSKKSYMTLDNKMAATSVVCDIDNGDTATTSTSALPMTTTYHIYNDLMNKTATPKSKKVTSKTMTTIATIETNSELVEKKMSKSNIDDIESTEEYFRSVEQIVQTMSERLAKNQREIAQEKQEKSISNFSDKIVNENYLEKLKFIENKVQLQSNSLPSENISPSSSCSLLSSIENYQQPLDRTMKLKRYNSQNITTDDIDSVTVMETADDTISCQRKDKKCNNLSLPASPLVKHRLDNFKLKTTSLTGLKFPKFKFNNNNNKKENENGARNLFNSPKMVRKIKQKLSYLDCSTDDDNDDEECHTSDDDGDDETSQLDDQNYIHMQHYQQYHRHSRTVNNQPSDNYSQKNVDPNLSEDSEPGSSKSINKINFLKELKQSKNRTSINNEVKQTKKRHHKTELDDKDSKRFLLHNKAPLWNEVSQVYQLDFGGRVTQESAKNFQIEFQGRQVMQFGRIDSNAYTLDFEYPFSAVQAMAVALANVTQRLK